jgi:uncharacterized protein
MPQPLSLSSLPLFPLDTVLFPDGHLSLRIFEMRYLNMVRKCQEVGAPFGVVTLIAGQEIQTLGAAPEQFTMEGTIASIADVKSPQPGLMTAQCRGVTRFRIRRYQQLPHGLWIADIRQMPPDIFVMIPEDLKPVADALAKVFQIAKERQQSFIQTTTEHLQDCGWVANRWCELLPIPVSLKQNLMSLENPLLRLELISDVLEQTGIAV